MQKQVPSDMREFSLKHKFPLTWTIQCKNKFPLTKRHSVYKQVPPYMEDIQR